MQDYEITWILPGESSDENIEDSIHAVKEAIGSKGGQVSSAEIWEKRELSYPIKKHLSGVYCVGKFSIDSRSVPEINHTVQADQFILRHLIVRID